MLQSASWRSHRRDPRSWVGWLAHDARDPALWFARRLAGVFLIASVVALFRGEWFAAFTCFCLHGIPEELVNSLALMWGGRFLVVTKSFVPQPLPIDDLLTLPPPESPFPCRVEVAKKGTVLGTDVGIVTFVEGWLHFEGHRTTFALRQSDVSSNYGDRLKLKNGGALTFEPQDCLIAEEFVELDLKKRFTANLKSWMRSDPPEGEPLFPPLTFHRSGAVRVWSELATSIASCLAAYAFLTWFDGAWWTALLALPFLKGLVVALGNVHRLERARSSPLPTPVVK